MTNIKVNIDRNKNQISVWNDGHGIPVEMHKTEGIMIPELIFGHLLVRDEARLIIASLRVTTMMTRKS
jgi:DNA gyrase/topoisomerase IV subunit B